MAKWGTDSLNALSEEVCGSEASALTTDEQFQKQKLSLRVVGRKIPPVFGSIG